jgi:hypothetical protein
MLNVTERAYTLAEIDRMRELIMWIDFYEGGGRWRSSAEEAALKANIEDRLRTYLTAGIAPPELEERLKALGGKIGP